MKRIILLLVVVLSVAASAHATEGKDADKDWCLLGNTDKCPGGTTFDLFEKIRRLEAAIKKGAAVYTPEELKHLQAMLEEAYETKELMNRY